ncbi:hypothetical protein J4E90_004314 [Alternaria incomplexa]|uniref:uncharacterized protein n=1 Tax=Alternaria triticimaculans TaxID=297637 RepID=UPI0020C2F0A5|nr:uncharacterized protein J4E78_010440 [Alternaria triticimaculans]XP_051292397.1 uncharacterized protein J4E90_004314 [Alternaria incomplexa]XP_051303517.1 uncharacterized protein J4E86_004883 [Alternaria arbusti]KAI4641377.1 hypothetical protein J4E78_010440 [Alternaria triticimaculans]KAI4915868.1 hypothetical protein J4E90_004314 [Alternaria incomplexa]KAI4957744.1 hypothetical protein J4E86_004883 [Alternaria arbusti]
MSSKMQLQHRHLPRSVMWMNTPIDRVAIPCMNDAEGIVTMPVPGRRCPACLERGDTVWVIPGKCCIQCGTPVN